MKFFYCFVYCLFSHVLLAQDSLLLNQTDEDGLRQGYWEQGVDEYICPVKKNPTYIVYLPYRDGKTIFKKRLNHNKSGVLVEFLPDSLYDSATKVLSGELIYKNRAEQIIEQCRYVKGRPTYLVYKSYQQLPDSLYVFEDRYYLDSTWNNNFGSFYYEYLINERVSNKGWYRDGDKGWSLYADTNIVNRIKYPEKYPYIKYYTPPLIAGIIGGNILSPHDFEIGGLLNLGASRGLVTGGMAGPSLTYRYAFETQHHGIDFDLGIYLPITLGLGVNTIFREKDYHMGFRTFIGTTIYNVQFTYSRNFRIGGVSESLYFNKYALRVKLAIPISKLNFKGVEMG